MFGHGSKTSYPPKTGHKKGNCPPMQANASNGNNVGPGSDQSYPPAAPGNKWPAPNNHATASEGQTTGHPSQKTSYPSKGGGGKQFVPTGGNKL